MLRMPRTAASDLSSDAMMRRIPNQISAVVGFRLSAEQRLLEPLDACGKSGPATRKRIVTTVCSFRAHDWAGYRNWHRCCRHGWLRRLCKLHLGLLQLLLGRRRSQDALPLVIKK